MLNSITNTPPEQPTNVLQTVHPSQYSQVEPFFFRYPSYLTVPQWTDGRLWRNAVRFQPILMICENFIIDTMLSMDWQIVATDSEKRKQYEGEIDYYTRGITKDFGISYTDLVEWIIQDLYELPFGAGVEIGRQNDDPNGKVIWIEPLDGTTLYPTLNEDWPVMQRLWEGMTFSPVYFPAHAIDRVKLSPRTEIMRKGWGMPPAEKVYIALDMLNRGDQYYANLLLDTPPAGILDLGDMEKQSALAWIGSFRNLMNGIDAFKIPVLYEHNTKVDFIQFGKNPNDVMYDKISLKLAAICASAYGETLSDIGLEHSSGGGGSSLSGAVRNERKTKQTGKAVAKRKVKEFFDHLLPTYLSFRYIDVDEEQSIATGRARLATSTAFHTMIVDGYISPGEARLQSIADGMFTVPIPESIPSDAHPQLTTPGFKESGSKQVGTQNVPVSQGGQGDVGTSLRSAIGYSKFKETLKVLLEKLPHAATDIRIGRLVKVALKAMYPGIKKSADLDDLELELWNSTQQRILFDDNVDDIDLGENGLVLIQQSNTDIENKLQNDLDKQKKWWEVISDDDTINKLLPLVMEEFSRSLEDTTIDLQNSLYEDGLTDTPTSPQSFSLTNSEMQKKLVILSELMADQINSGTAYYVRKIVMSAVRDTMSTSLYSEQVKQGLDISTLLADNRLIRTIVQLALLGFEDLVNIRSTTIADYEVNRIDKLAVQEEYKQVGLKTKAWRCYGNDPCPTCLDNQAKGFVPMSFRYKSVFPDSEIEAPPAHPKVEHCGLIFDKTELANLYNQGNFKFWYGD